MPLGNVNRESVVLMFFENLAARIREAEVMDQPQLDFDQHCRALTGLARLNRLSDSVGASWGPIERIGRQFGRPLRILDLATGGGDIPIGLWQRARRVGLNVEILGLDISPRAVEIARGRADRGAAAVRFAQGDALCGDLPDDFDVVVSSLFLHHLDDNEAVELLARMAVAARHLVLVNDLVRSLGRLAMVAVATRLVTRSDVVRVDGLRSIRAAFTMDELRQLARSAGLEGATVSRRWPCRMLLEWNRSLAAPWVRKVNTPSLEIRGRFGA